MTWPKVNNCQLEMGQLVLIGIARYKTYDLPTSDTHMPLGRSLVGWASRFFNYSFEGDSYVTIAIP